MRLLYFTYILLLMLGGILLAQDNTVLQKVVGGKSLNGTGYPADAREYLERFYKFNGIDPAKFQMPANVLKKTTSWGFTVGTQKSFYVYDLTPGKTYLTSFTCRAVGVNCYIFVEDTSWTKYVDQNAVDSLRIYFDSKTPANPNKGIFQTDVDAYGNPPDVDSDPKIIILVLNIRDGWKPGNGYVAGYYSSDNETGNVGIGTLHNAPAEIYHVDCYPTNLKTSSGLVVGLSTTAHEFQHMIHWNYKHDNDETFFDEGCSMIAEWINGFKIDDYLFLYSQTPNRYLLYWNGSDPNDVLNDYGRAADFFLYLKEQFYDSNNLFFKKYVQSVNYGITAFDTDVFPGIGTSRRFADVLIDWWIANYLNDRSVNPYWGFKYSNITPVSSTTISNPNVTNGSGSVYKQAATYRTYISGKNLSINFNTNGVSGINLRAIEIGSTAKQVVTVNPSINFTVPDFGTTYTNVTFLVCHNDNNASLSSTTPFPFSYVSTGASTGSFQVTISSNPPAGGTTSGAGTYSSGQSVTVTAIPNSGYSFVNWTEGGTVVSTSLSYTFTITTDRNLIANFIQGSSPSIPVLLEPLNGAIVTNPTLKWNASSGAASYRLQVSTNSSFTPATFDQSGITGMSQQLSGLTNNSTYYWHVNAANTSGTSDWSSTWSFTTTAPQLPNLTPYLPSGWSDKIVITHVLGTRIDASLVSNIRDIYVNWAIINNGTAAISTPFSTALDIDGLERQRWTTISLDINQSYGITDYDIGKLSAGPHTFQIVTDVTNVITESNEQDNLFTKQITVVDQTRIQSLNYIPGEYSISQNYPNPFNPSTKIRFDIPNTSLVRLTVYDILGRVVKELINSEMNPGSYEVTFDATKFPSGIYFYKIQAGDFTETKKLLLLK